MARYRGHVESAARGHGRPAPAASPVSHAYAEMLADALPSSPTEKEEGRTIKKRRVGGKIIVKGTGNSQKENAELETSLRTTSMATALPLPRQTAYNDSEDSEESDFEWEDVHLGGSSGGLPQVNTKSEAAELDIVLQNPSDGLSQSAVSRRKPITSEDRKLRVEVHKMNILCLLSHAHVRNHWCNDSVAQAALKKILPEKTISYLIDDEDDSQFQRNRSLHDGLRQACDAFKTEYKIISRGIVRAFWADDSEALANSEIPDDIELPMQKSDFRRCASKLSGSRDVGAQLFCTLLRSLGVETRLVCSLQPLPFIATAKGTTPLKRAPTLTISYPETRTSIEADESCHGISIDKDSGSDGGWRVARIKSNLDMRLGRSPRDSPRKALVTPSATEPRPKRSYVRESSYPVYWVEVFNAAHQKWIAVDPLVTSTIGKPPKLEPPASDFQNRLVYAVSFEDDGSARDVTRRYAKAYNAKTRKLRIESLKNGCRWWKRTMRIYRRLYPLDRDQVEDAEMATKEAQEPMPSNVQDFKNHPYYALERHLRRNEVIHPRKETGKLTTGKGGLNSNKVVEPIYRRRDVHMVKSADSWYRLGREIKVGEQPLKRLQPRRRTAELSEDDDSTEGSGAGTAMYAGFQTCTYQAPPVVNGRIPRNQYGNLDIYVASMVPPGGVHVAHSDAAKAARLMEIDYADAVTGFDFRGRYGTAVIKGAVVAVQFQDAIAEVIRGYEYDRSQAEELQRSLLSLRMWKRLYAGLRIRERIEGYSLEGQEDANRAIDKTDEIDTMHEDIDEGGGFLPERDEPKVAQPTGAQRNFVDIQSGREVNPIVNFVPAGNAGAGSPKPQQTSLVPSEIELYPNRMEVFEQDGGGLVPLQEAGRSKQKELHGHHVPSTLLGQTLPLLNEDGQIYAPAHFASEETSLGISTREFKEAQLLQRIFEAERRGKGHVVIPEQASNEQELDSEPIPMDDATGQEASRDIPTDFKEQSREATQKSESDGSDRGSLMSHDPEDSDADPEWLL